MMGRDFIAVASAAMRRTSRCSFAGTFELVTVRQRLFKVRVSRALSREKPGAPSKAARVSKSMGSLVTYA